MGKTIDPLSFRARKGRESPNSFVSLPILFIEVVNGRTSPFGHL